MEIRMQIIITVIVLVGVFYVLSLIRRGRLELKYALAWIAVAVMVIIFDWLPGFMSDMADFLGIVSPMNMLYFLGFLFVLVILLTVTVASSIASGSVKRLTQKIAILEKRVRELEAEQKQTSSDKREEETGATDHEKEDKIYP